jgi:iron complex outermembrane receptor protein
MTPAYTLFNFRSSYEWQNFRVDFAIENLTNTLYYPALGGFNMGGYIFWTNYNFSRFPVPSAVPGTGRNIVAGLTVKF